MKLKVCGMKFPQNISEIESLRPDFMGFIFYNKSKRFFDQTDLVLNDKINRVGVFVNEEIEEIKEKIIKFKLDFVHEILLLIFELSFHSASLATRSRQCNWRII